MTGLLTMGHFLNGVLPWLGDDPDVYYHVCQFSFEMALAIKYASEANQKKALGMAESIIMATTCRDVSR